ncbi:MAG: hypothetical protein KGL39_56525 [Patescibacteria group bacterium]|nr:hypothetical protein [Patescibacteria group bacterium]
MERSEIAADPCPVCGALPCDQATNPHSGGLRVVLLGEVSLDQRSRVLAIEAVAKSLCLESGQDAADGTMMLLTAAVHIASKHSAIPIQRLLPKLAEALGAATVAADEFFKLRMVAND